jgi:hypothetical protein
VRRRIPREVAVFWAVATVILVGVPAALNAARSSSYTASFVVAPIQRSDHPRRADPKTYVRSLLADPRVDDEAVQISGLPLGESALRGVSATAIPDGVRLVVRANSPANARKLARGFRHAVANASARQHGAGAYAVVAGPLEPAPRANATADRLLERMPGALPPRPSLAWSIFVGLVVATLVAVGAYVFRAGAR